MTPFDIVHSACPHDCPSTCALEVERISPTEIGRIHGAKANTSDKRRAGYTMRYFPTTSLVYHDNSRNANHKIWLARGVDVAGNRYQNA